MCEILTSEFKKNGSGVILIRNDESELVETTVFLGLTLGKKLQWGPHIDALAKRLSSAAFAIKKLKNLSDTKITTLVYFGSFHGLMSYGILLWGCATDIYRISFYNSGPLAQFTGWDLVFLLDETVYDFYERTPFILGHCPILRFEFEGL
ncbi:hypothetical protein EVAR_97407_1 [Eumeta japonica]|uniref:Uncharacterized protein n=1 Tax=Eumeta variegata TaxID=151549 RepID=A0A4C1WWS0_EUMVA|nr:hypothetical protein EVAR_97407_1 [Eumeta japonica]